MKNIIIYDALSITSKIHQAADFIEMLGLENVNWQTVKGAHGYLDRLYFDTISIHFNGTEEMGIWLEMMGQGCRAFETYGNGDYEELFAQVFANSGDMKITRLDVAFDDHDGVIDLNLLCEETRKQNFVTRFSEWQVIEGSKGNAINHGSLKSEVFIRIYDKAKERGKTDGSHWVRCELQLRRDRAMQFARITGKIGERYSGVLRNYLRYVQQNESESNKSRWSEAEYWTSFLGNAATISIYNKTGVDYNMIHLENFVFKQAGNAIDTYIKIRGIDTFKAELKQRGTKPNPKYEEIERQCRL